MFPHTKNLEKAPCSSLPRTSHFSIKVPQVFSSFCSRVSFLCGPGISRISCYLASSSHRYCLLLCRFLTYCPSKRILSDEGLKHEYFRESPLPIDPSMFPTWPAKSEQQRVKRGTSPRPPEGGLGYSQLVSSLHSSFSCDGPFFRFFSDICPEFLAKSGFSFIRVYSRVYSSKTMSLLRLW